MKRNTLLGILGLALILVSCHSEEKMIQNAAFGYLDAMGNYRIKEAEQFASKETIETTLKVIETNIMPNMDSTYIKRNTPAIIEILDITKETDTTATVSYKKTTPIKVQNGTLNLVKRDEKWQAVVSINVPAPLLMKTDTAEARAAAQKSVENRQFRVVKEVPDKFKKSPTAPTN